MELVLIRHTSVNVEPGICYGQSDVPVRGSFPQEAAAVKEKLAGMDFDAVYSSPLSRCVKLARYCGYDNPILDARLMEMDFGEWEMKHYDDITDPRLKLWFDDYINVQATGGESSMQQRARFIGFIDNIRKQPHSRIAIFTHGGIIIHALAAFTGLSYSQAFRHQPGYGAIVRIEI